MHEVSHMMIFLYFFCTETYNGCCLYNIYNITINAIKQIRFVDSVAIYFQVYTCSS